MECDDDSALGVRRSRHLLQRRGSFYVNDAIFCNFLPFFYPVFLFISWFKKTCHFGGVANLLSKVIGVPLKKPVTEKARRVIQQNHILLKGIISVTPSGIPSVRLLNLD